MNDMNPIEVQKYLSGIDYPASGNNLVEAARANGAGEKVIEALQNISGDTFETPAEVSEALGEEM